jgi:hypothetical protein
MFVCFANAAWMLSIVLAIGSPFPGGDGRIAVCGCRCHTRILSSCNAEGSAEPVSGAFSHPGRNNAKSKSVRDPNIVLDECFIFSNNDENRNISEKYYKY